MPPSIRHLVALAVLLGTAACREAPALDTGDGPSSPSAHEPTLVGVEARASGRSGTDLRLSVTVDDADADFATLRLRALDAQGRPVDAFDYESASEWTLVVDPDHAATGQRIEATFVLEGGMPVSLQFRPAQVALTVSDLAGHVSPERIVPIAPQAEVESGEACDPDQVQSRCAPGLACEGAPARCGEAAPPVVTRVGYRRWGRDARIVIEGTAPADDLASLQVRFLDNSGYPTSPDFDDDGSPDESQLVTDAGLYSRLGRFLIVVEPAGVFADLVPKVAVSVTDGGGRASSEVVARLDAFVTRGEGAVCSLDGFDACEEGTVGGAAAGQASCTLVAEHARRRCVAARSLDPAAGRTVSVGRVAGASLVDAPEACGALQTALPEAIVPLHLASDAPTLVLTTDRPATTFDTRLSLRAGPCGPPAALEPVATCDGAPCCADDPGFGATLSLSAVPSGDYVVVIESNDRRGGDFELAVSVGAASAP